MRTSGSTLFRDHRSLLRADVAGCRCLWRDPTRLRANTEAGKHTREQAAAFVDALVRRFALDPASIMPLAEAGAPATAIGYVFPLDHSEEGKWITDDWTPALGRGPLLLLPGESTAGLRLPFAQLGEKNLRRALTAEIQNATLTIFVPPLLLPSYVILLTAIEDTLAALALRE